MSNADEMLEKCGWEQGIVYKGTIQYINKNSTAVRLYFDENIKQFMIKFNFHMDGIVLESGVLEAINKKCEELGWIE